MGGKKKRTPAAGKRRTGKKLSPGSGKPVGRSISQGTSKLLQPAFRCYLDKNISAAIGLLDMIAVDTLPDSDKLDYYRLKSYACANSDRLTDAESAAQDGMKLDDADRDFHFALSFVYASFKDYDLCLEYGWKFIELVEQKKNDSSPVLYLSDNYHHLVHNYMGLAFKAKKELKKAESAFLFVIELIPGDEHAYLNLANMYFQMNDFDKADKIVKAGLKKCSQVQELRMLEQSLKNRTTICACMIVKNEEEFLENCLDSIRSWVDDIIIVDTGSTDRTVEIAKSYGAKVYFQEWDGSFSRARNFSISKATCDWILYIDADEEFVQEDISLLRQAISQKDHRLVSLVINNIDRKTGEGASSLTYNRVFRSDAGFHFEGIVHNQLKHDKDEPVLRTPVRLKHYGYHLDPEKMKKKLARSRELLEKQIESNPDDSFAHFNLAQLLRSISIKDDSEAHNLGIVHAEKVIELTAPSKTIHLMAHDQIASFYYAKRMFKKAEEYSLKALELKGDYLDPLILLGLIYLSLNNNDKAEEYCNRYLDEQAKQANTVIPDGMLVTYLRARHVAFRTLGQIWLARKNLDKAEEFFRKALNEQEPFEDVYIRLAGVYLDKKEPDKANELIDKELTLRPDSDLAHLFKGRYFSLKGDTEEATQYYGKALELTKDNELVFQRVGSFFADYGNPELALEAYNKLTRYYPKNHGGWKAMAKINFGLGKYTDCEKALRVCLELESNDSEVMTNLANCMYLLERFEDAEKYYEQAMAGSEQPAAFRGLGLTRYRLGKLKEALVLLEKYLTIAPDEIGIELTIGSIYGQMGDYSSAIQHFERLLKANPGDLEALYHLSECYRLMGHVESAVIGYRQILSINPDYGPAKQRLHEFETQAMEDKLLSVKK